VSTAARQAVLFDRRITGQASRHSNRDIAIRR
jgi:hypothetical protein